MIKERSYLVIEAKEVRPVQEVMRSDGLWRFACGDVFSRNFLVLEFWIFEVNITEFHNNSLFSMGPSVSRNLHPPPITTSSPSWYLQIFSGRKLQPKFHVLPFNKSSTMSLSSMKLWSQVSSPLQSVLEWGVHSALPIRKQCVIYFQILESCLSRHD